MLDFRSRLSIRKFIVDQRANAAIIFGLSALVLIGLTGMGVDYYTALSAKAQLDLATDAASIEAINTVANYIKANPSLSATTAFANASSLAQTQALNTFTVNAGKNAKLAGTPTISIPSRVGQTITATVSYTAASPAAFGPLVSIHNLNFRGTSTASLTLPTYLDFYLLLDISGSMGLPADAAGQTLLASINPDNNNQNPIGNNANFCAFACHFSGNACTQYVSSTRSVNSSIACQGYSLAASNGITLRAAAVGQAVSSLLNTAQATQTMTDQYRVGLYPFIKNMGTLYKLSYVSTDLANLTSAANTLGNLLDTGDSTSPYGSGGTHIDSALNSINSTITSVGDGSSTQSTQPFVFLVTDGAENFQYYPWNTTYQPSYPAAINPANTSAASGDSTPYLFDTSSPASSNWPTLCSQLKNRNITVSILYLPYVPINPPSTFAGMEDYKVNWIIPGAPNPLNLPAPPATIPAILQACASPGFFFTANSTADITNAMQAMFAQSVAAAHLTH